MIIIIIFPTVVNYYLIFTENAQLSLHHAQNDACRLWLSVNDHLFWNAISRILQKPDQGHELPPINS